MPRELDCNLIHDKRARVLALPATGGLILHRGATLHLSSRPRSARCSTRVSRCSPLSLPGRRCSIAASTLSLTTCSWDLGRQRATAHPAGSRPAVTPASRSGGRVLTRGFPLEIDADRYGRLVEIVVAERDGLDGFDIALSTTPGEPVADFARETAT